MVKKLKKLYCLLFKHKLEVYQCRKVTDSAYQMVHICLRCRAGVRWIFKPKNAQELHWARTTAARNKNTKVKKEFALRPKG